MAFPQSKVEEFCMLVNHTRTRARPPAELENPYQYQSDAFDPRPFPPLSTTLFYGSLIFFPEILRKTLQNQ